MTELAANPQIMKDTNFLQAPFRGLGVKKIGMENPGYDQRCV
jgi:hypothetical protein